MKRKILWTLGVLFVFTVIPAVAFSYILFARTEGSAFDSKGVKIYYTVEGKGEPVILIHGIGANADLNWRRPGVVCDLADEYKVITMDLRGHGLSDRPETVEAYGIELVEDVTRLMDHLKIDRAHIAGYSLGGFIALKFATVHPERVRSLAVCAAGWKDPNDPNEIPNPYGKPGQAKPVPAKPVAKAAVLPDFGKGGLYDWAKDKITDRLAPKAARRAMRKSFMELAVPLDHLKANKVPTLCVIGDQDGLLSMAEALKANTEDLEYVLLQGPNHLTTPFYPSFKRTLHEFIRKHAEK